MSVSILLDVLGIAACGGTGGALAFFTVESIGLDGTPGAFVAAILGMIFAVALWAASTTAWRHLRRTH